MNTQALKDVLQELRAELQSEQPLDPQLKALLVELDADIHRVIHRSEAGEHAPDLIERAQAASTGATAQLAAQHPRLKSTLRQLADALGKMGI